ncbi:hypothetical protein SETIT_1G120200v2 [Setaria italica]|uniref:Uncharacterized protein n=2 Tax=Setaria TaxID=4554 RepID=A0A368PJE4_SETIT|nr:hypothetical protein SETIT_1G120200v2 [Setaria italica]TKW38500.1 hypothetical protein SEVIR_1G118900v2 [Setaria viridis]
MNKLSESCKLAKRTKKHKSQFSSSAIMLARSDLVSLRESIQVRYCGILQHEPFLPRRCPDQPHPSLSSTTAEGTVATVATGLLPSLLILPITANNNFHS